MTTKRTTKHRLPGMTCPDCGGPATQRTARAITSIVREVGYRCENDSCGTGFIAQISTIRITQRSATPQAGSEHIPFAAHARVAQPANDDQPIERPPTAHDHITALTG